MLASDIVELKKDVKTDDAETKRVELHLHTQMSAMDAVTPVEKLVERAAQWGHKAIAVTDHGVVQAYPEAYSAGKKHNVKIIYGVECYLVNDEIPIVTASDGADTGHKLTGGFVVFDIETTGLNPTKDGITEIGAVKSKTERSSTLQHIRRSRYADTDISQSSRITDAMVAGAPGISQGGRGFS